MGIRLRWSWFVGIACVGCTTSGLDALSGGGRERSTGGSGVLDGSSSVNSGGSDSMPGTGGIPSGGRSIDGGGANGAGGVASSTGGVATEKDSSTSSGGDGGIVPSGADGSAGDGTAVGVIGQSCSLIGAYACAGHAQKGQLVCVGGSWQANGTCSGRNNCDTTPGSSAGSCQPVVPGCDSKSADTIICEGADRVTCGIDLVKTTPVASCPFLCVDGACTGVCAPTTRRCDGLTPETCDASGTWLSASACTNLCSGGACSGTCAPKAKQCNGQVVQTCDATGTWQDGIACMNQACVSGVCQGVCSPGTKQCSNNGIQMCSSGGQWGTAATCTGQAC